MAINIDNEILEGLLDDAGVKGGEALEEMGVTDLAALSRDQWLTFLYNVMDGFLAAAFEKRKLSLVSLPITSDEIPY